MAQPIRPQNKQIVDPRTGRLALEWDAYFARTEQLLAAQFAGGVTSFEGRTGIVVSAAGDYTASEITNVAAGNIAATTVQAAINELDSEKIGGSTGGTDNAVLRADGTSGKTLQATGIIVDDDDVMIGVAGLHVDGATPIAANALTGNVFVDVKTLLYATATTVESNDEEFMVVFDFVSDHGAGAAGNDGNKVSLYAGISSETNSGPIWALNTVTNILSGSSPTFAHGYECDITNLTGSHNGDDDGLTGVTSTPFSCGINISGGGSDRNTAAMMVSGPGSDTVFNRGIVFVNDCIRSATFQDLCDADISLDIRGSHTTGLDLSNATISGDAIELASGHKIGWNSDDVTITHAASTLAFAGAASGYTFADGPVVPATSDGAALGTSSLLWSDLFLASGAVVNFNNGDATLTHAANTLTFAGASSGYQFANGPIQPSTDDGIALGVSGTAFSDLFLASGGVLNWAAGDVTITHASNVLTFAGADSDYIFQSDEDAGTTQVRIHNSGDGNTVTKLSALGFYGTDTVGTVKTAARIECNPGDSNWVTAGLHFYVRTSDATAEAYRLTSNRLPIWSPASATPETLGANGQITMTLTSNTNLRFSARGSDGTTRVANLTLA